MSDEPQDPTPEPDDALGDAGKKALEAERKARRDAEKQAKELESQLKAIQDQGKSELERLTEQVTQLASERDRTAAERDRYTVALEKKLTPTQAKRLVGSTLDELTADADALLADLGVNQSSETEPPTRQPRPQLSGGTDPGAADIGSDEIRAAVEAARL